MVKICNRDRGLGRVEPRSKWFEKLGVKYVQCQGFNISITSPAFTALNYEGRRTQNSNTTVLAPLGIEPNIIKYQPGTMWW